ncbi:hypothetical protein TSUD_88560 [Trifolium subterraneum]|uniref:Uncharacterized protein n=1 Tax=Trifolium subterraneum TaxID=3900 RepID=A0A2Z6PQQ8_TRISU|nr:hypothetical protein TSUD_88560 [Trifolium subterraneum]
MRRRDPDEADPLRWTRSNTTHQCQRCLEYGHNARTCKLPAPKKKNDVADKNVASASNACASNDATNTTSANVPLTQASQTNAPKKRGRPKGSKNIKRKDPNAPKVPKVAKVPNAPKAPKNANAHASQVADETPNAHASQAITKAPNAHASQVTAEAPNAHGHLIYPDLLADILVGDDDEVPDMLSKRLYCTAPPSIEPVPAKAQPTWDDISKKLTQ